jgi:hypothetical protein
MLEFIDESTALDLYDEMLDELYSPINIAGIEFDPSRVLKELDPTAYRCGFNDWLDSCDYTIDPDESEIYSEGV